MIHYSAERLHEIGRNMDGKVPTMALDAMAQYQLSRAAADEKLFHSFVGHVNTKNVATKERLDTVEAVANECARRHDGERVSSSASVVIIVKGLKGAVCELTDTLTLQDLAAVLKDEFDQEAASTEDQIATTAVVNAALTNRVTAELQQFIQKSAEDNKLAADKVIHLTDRVTKLEDLVRALTAQKTPSPELAQQIQRLPLTSSSGQALDLDLSVPKGKPFVHLKDKKVSSRAASPAVSGPSASERVTESAVASIPTEDADKPLPPVPAAQQFPSVAPAVTSAPASTGRTKNKWQDPPLFLAAPAPPMPVFGAPKQSSNTTKAASPAPPSPIKETTNKVRFEDSRASGQVNQIPIFAPFPISTNAFMTKTNMQKMLQQVENLGGPVAFTDTTAATAARGAGETTKRKIAKSPGIKMVTPGAPVVASPTPSAASPSPASFGHNPEADKFIPTRFPGGRLTTVEKARHSSPARPSVAGTPSAFINKMLDPASRARFEAAKKMNQG